MTEQLPAPIPDLYPDGGIFLGPEPNLVHRNGILGEPDQEYAFEDGKIILLWCGKFCKPKNGDKWTLTWPRLGLTIWLTFHGNHGSIFSRLIAGPTG